MDFSKLLILVIILIRKALLLNRLVTDRSVGMDIDISDGHL